MNKNAAKTLRRSRRRIGIRKRVEGMPGRPRLSIYKSLNHMYAQVINDLTQTTLASAATTEKELKVTGKTGNVAAAKALGKLLAERAKKAGIQEVVFDRGGFRFHGRVKALADACREGGLKF